MQAHSELLSFLDLVDGHFALFGSSVLAVRGIRESQDIDVLVSQALRDLLIGRFPDRVQRIRPGSEDLVIAFEDKGIEILNTWIHLYGEEQKMIDEAEMIDGLPYVKLAYFRRWKEKMGREKDKKDLALLDAWENDTHL